MKSRSICLWVLVFVIQFTFTSWAEDDPFKNQAIQGPKLEGPGKGSLAGELGATEWSGSDISKGMYSIPLEFQYPNQRGNFIYPINPTYSPSGGLTEWGLGVSFDIKISRFRSIGALDFKTDDLMSPWGQLVKGDDGSYYPKGLQKAIKVKFSQEDEITAYLPDGSVYIFGKNGKVIRTPEGIYSWYLVEARSARNEVSHFVYSDLTKNHYYLDHVLYGGNESNPQYQVSIEYEPIRTPFIDYRSSIRQELDRRVKTVSIAVKQNGFLSSLKPHVERYRYEMEYLDDDPGIGFWISSIQKKYASGEIEYKKVFDYHRHSEFLDKNDWQPIDKMNQLQKEYGIILFDADRATPVSLEQNGVMGFEIPKANYSYLKPEGDRFVLENLPPLPSQSEQDCRQFKRDYSVPRIHASLRGPHSPMEVIRVAATVISRQSTLFVCDRVGHIIQKSQYSDLFDLGPFTRLVDINQDGKPDIVRYKKGTLQIILNQSTPEKTEFASDFISIPLEYKVAANPKLSANPLLASAFFLTDVNGDGIPDVVLQLGSGFAIFYGTGNMKFEQNYEYFKAQYQDKHVHVFQPKQNVIFQDLNRDGIPELIIYANGHFAMFSFDGTGFKQIKPKGIDTFFSTRWGRNYARIVVGDFLGNGNTQLAASSSLGYYALNLTDASSGLLKSVDDGKGNILEFSYDYSKVQDGFPTRTPVMSKMVVKEAGKDSKTSHFNFSEASTSRINGSLLGFTDVEIMRKHQTIQEKFVHNDDVTTLPVRVVEVDSRNQQIHKSTEYAYESQSFHGIPFERKKFEKSSFLSATSASQVSKTTEFHAYQDVFCPSSIEESSEGKTLLRTMNYDKAPLLNENVTCLESSILLSGTHKEASKNFTHSILIQREGHGLPVKIFNTGAGNARLMQSIEYNSDLNPISLWEAGKGTTRYEYDPSFRLMGVTNPDLTSVQASSIDPTKDQILSLTHLHGGNSNWTHFFDYDGLERLKSEWNNLYPASNTVNPLKTYQYKYADHTHLGWIQQIDKIFSQNQVSEISEIEFQSGMGSEVGKALATGAGWDLRDLKRESPDDFSITQFARKFTSMNPTHFDLTQFFDGLTPVKYEEKSTLGFPLRSEELFQTNVHGQVQTHSQIGSKHVVSSHIENDHYTTTDELDFDLNPLSYQNQDHHKYHYQYDALSRLVEINLPQDSSGGTLGEQIHQIKYDAEGRVSEIFRSGIGKIVYSYDPQSGLLVEKTFFGDIRVNPSNLKPRSIRFEYDPIGRIVKKIGQFTKKEGGQTVTEFDYFYDGKTPVNVSFSGQTGFLTGVKGPDYFRTLKYRPDGKMIEKTTQIANWQTLIEKTDYYSDGTPISTVFTLNKLGSDQPVVKNTETFEKDHLGRLATYQYSQKNLYTLNYNSHSKLDRILVNQQNYQFHYDELTQKLREFSLSGNSKFSNQWRFNSRGLIESEKVVLGGQEVSKNYSYSNRKQLVQESSEVANIHYSYGPNDLLSEFGIEDQIHSIKSSIQDWKVKENENQVQYDLDSEGRVIRSPSGHFEYNAEGRVSKILHDGKPPITYGYDENGNRLFKKSGDQFTEAYLENIVILERQLLKLVIVSGIVLGITLNDEFIPLLADHRGSILQNDAGAIEVPSSYGERISHRSDTSFLIDYVSQGYDPDLKAYRMLARDYDPAIKRFLTPDPLFLEGPQKCVESSSECNLYSYAGGNPVSFVDPSGLDVYLLLDPKGAGENGHAALIVENKEAGYQTMSMGTMGGTFQQIFLGATLEGIDINKANSFGAALEIANKSANYSDILHIPISSAQDKAMVNYADERFLNKMQEWAPTTVHLPIIVQTLFVIPSSLEELKLKDI